ASAARAIVLTQNGGKRAAYPAEIAPHDRNSAHIGSVTFKGPFDEKTAYTLNLPPDLQDDAGRPLENRLRFPLAVATDEQPPLVKFPARFGIVEAGGDRILPVTVRNVEASLKGQFAGTGKQPAGVKGALARLPDGDDAAVIAWMRLLSSGKPGNEQWTGEWIDQRRYARPMFPRAQATSFDLPKPNGRRAFEVVGIPLKQPGFYIAELASPKLGKVIVDGGGTAHVQAAALVTNLAAHVKRGAESSLVWVTTLDKGRPVAGADIAVRDCNAAPLWQGKTGADGIARIRKPLESTSCRSNDHLYVSARSGGDMTFTLTDWTGGIEPYRFNVQTGGRRDTNVFARTVFDRTLLRAGETVHMKHFLRRHTQDGLATATAGKDKDPVRMLVIAHVGSDERYEIALDWQNGIADAAWQIPAQAKLGTYELTIGAYAAGSFRVESFRVPTMKALLQGPGKAQVQPTRLDLDVQLAYLAGGPAASAPVKLRTVVQPKGVSFPGYDGFRFAEGDVKEGRTDSEAGFDDDDGETPLEDATPGAAQAVTRTAQLDRNGAARIAIEPLPPVTAPQDLLAELEYQDANGETQTVSRRIALWPAALVVGVKPDSWASRKDQFKFQALALKLDGTPATDTAVEVELYERRAYSHRKRLNGGFYAYDNYSEVRKLGPACSGRTDAKGLLHCDIKAPVSGNLIIRVAARDADNRLALTHTETWVAGDDERWYGATDSDRIDLLPEQKQVEPGQHATFQIRMPFRTATALITVEREGILDAYVRQLSAKIGSFSIPMKPHYTPNVFVSAMVVRGRVAGPAPTALVDLAKPAYKMGLAGIEVGLKARTLEVAVSSDKEVYKTREKATIKIQVARADGKALPAGAEVAVAAVDTGLLELMPNTSWNLLEGMYAQRGLQVETSTAQMQVIGKRHYGRKAFPHGGGGGKSAGRELFDTLLFWKARVALAADGSATVEVPLNDSLTAFRIVAVAHAGSDLFGTGARDIRASQDLIVTSGLPQIARDGDTVSAAFSVRNAGAQPLAITAAPTVTADDGKPKALAVRQLTLAPGEARELAWEYTVPASARELQWDFSAHAEGASDKLRIKQRVIEAVPVRTYQATLLQLDTPLGKPFSMPVAAPNGALPGRGGLNISFAARLGDELPAVRTYMAAYSYICFEQIASKAVALRDKAMWTNHMNALPSHLDSAGLVKYFALMLEGSDALTAYVLSVADEAGYALPDASRERMLAGLADFVYGRVTRDSAMPTADLAVRKLAALEALSRYQAVRPDMLETFALEPNLWPTSAVLDWYMLLRRTEQLPERAARLAQAQQILRARLNFQGTTMGFSTERSDNWWWLMVSPDVNANRLLMAMADAPEWKSDIGRVARGSLGRQQQGRWNTTVANAWGVLALEKFSKLHEAVAPAGATTAQLAGASKAVDWTRQKQGG
ncbi:MAG TPA: MG2 domain-containing protein, partial [Burkholderiaceae bacterium]